MFGDDSLLTVTFVQLEQASFSPSNSETIFFFFYNGKSTTAESYFLTEFQLASSLTKLIQFGPEFFFILSYQ